MTTRVDVEELSTTKGEKLLAVVLSVFLIAGGLWVYFNVDSEPQFSTGDAYAQLTAAEREAIDRRTNARRLVNGRVARVDAARETAIERREAYRTSLDENRPDPALAAAFRRAEANLARARRDLRRARSELGAATPEAETAESRIPDLVRREEARAEANRDHDERVTAARRLGFILVSFAASLLLLGRLRRARSRWLAAAMSAVAAATALGAVMAVDYVTDYVDPFDAGVLVLSLTGSAITLLAFAALQRYLARRLPQRRVRKGECPFCGFPSTGQEHCEGCGREVIAPCATCTRPRRVGAAHCGACGAG
jgi:hypothetical protein